MRSSAVKRNKNFFVFSERFTGHASMFLAFKGPIHTSEKAFYSDQFSVITNA